MNFFKLLVNLGIVLLYKFIIRFIYYLIFIYEKYFFILNIKKYEEDV